jgi:hypothetical protein
MKKICLFVLVACLTLLISYSVFAATDAGSVPRGSTTQYDGESVFTNLSATGKDVSGVPGYLKLYGLALDGTTVIPYYLWVDETGDVRVASETTMASFTSFPDVAAWTTKMGTVVGSQS